MLLHKFPGQIGRLDRMLLHKFPSEIGLDGMLLHKFRGQIGRLNGMLLHKFPGQIANVTKSVILEWLKAKTYLHGCNSWSLTRC